MNKVISNMIERGEFNYTSLPDFSTILNRDEELKWLIEDSFFIVRYKDVLDGDEYTISLYQLLFDPSLQFVECLVGDAGYMCQGDELTVCELDRHGKYVPGTCLGLDQRDGSREGCQYLVEISPANHHRREMANLPDIEALKQYVRGLGQEPTQEPTG